MRKTHHRSQTCFVISQLIETLAKLVTQKIEGGEDPIVKVLLAQLISSMLNRVDLWTVSWLRYQTDVGRDDQLAGPMPASLIDLHHNEKVGASLAHML